MQNIHRKVLAGMLALSFVGGLAACSDDDEDSDSDTETTQPTDDSGDAETTVTTAP